MPEHRWSGWPGAWCLDCGTEDAREVALASSSGNEDDVHHRYSDKPHVKGNCTGCSEGDCPEPGSKRNDPYARAAERKSGA
jgi:hypothetical protein